MSNTQRVWVARQDRLLHRLFLPGIFVSAMRNVTTLSACGVLLHDVEVQGNGGKEARQGP